MRYFRSEMVSSFGCRGSESCELGLMNPGISDFSADNPPVRARLAITPTAQTHQQNRNNKRALISSPGKLT